MVSSAYDIGRTNASLWGRELSCHSSSSTAPSSKPTQDQWFTIYKDHITLKDYEIHDGMGLQL
ncbi:ubiquitin-like protein 5 [Cinnamomum micranthum f. kanehirae]|uniref:Ubiquitin-like protein 5 n=1 Tax=Cinnamomum micranthum f. kanehirae TaxID=337451 RepID=A0A3S3Q8D5_9MAGN|nr:ubiquitin-like protein 5 [Cinnamomum micranthum f. kanehirae]